MAPGSDGTGWPGHPLCCRCLPCARSPIRSVLVPCSRCSLLPCCAPPLCLVLVLAPPGVAPAFCVSVLLLPLSVGAPGCPFRAPTPVPPACPPRTRVSHLRTTWTVPCAVGWSRPCCHPRGGHLPARGAQPPPLWSMWALVEGGGGGCCLMASSACAAFGGCYSARTSWFLSVLLCAPLLCCLRSSQFRALSSCAGTLTAAGVPPPPRGKSPSRPPHWPNVSGGGGGGGVVGVQTQGVGPPMGGRDMRNPHGSPTRRYLPPSPLRQTAARGNGRSVIHKGSEGNLVQSGEAASGRQEDSGRGPSRSRPSFLRRFKAGGGGASTGGTQTSASSRRTIIFAADFRR